MSKLNWSEPQCLLRLFPLVISISFAMDVFVPALPDMAYYFVTSTPIIQANLYLFMLTVAVGQLFMGQLADLLGRRYIALIAAILFIVGSFVSALAPSVWVLLIGRVIQAIGACGTYVLCFIIIRDNYQTQACGRLFSLLNGCNAVVASSAPIIGGILFDLTRNWRYEFYFLTGLGFLILIGGFFNIPHYKPTKQTTTSRWASYKQILSSPTFLCFSFITSTAHLGLYLFCALSPGILMDDIGISGAKYGLLFGMNALTVFMANFIASRLTYQIPLKLIVKAGICIMSIACLLMITFNLKATNQWSFMLPMLLLTSGIGLTMGCSAALALQDFKTLSSSATSLLGAIQYGSAAIIGLLIANIGISPFNLATPVITGCIFSMVTLSAAKQANIPPIDSGKGIQS